MSKIPLEFWQRHRILPLEETDERFSVGLLAEGPREVLEDIRLFTDKDVRPVFLTQEQLEEGLHRLVLAGAAGLADGLKLGPADESAAEDLLGASSDNQNVAFVNRLFLEAMEKRASDIHIEPFESNTIIRLRVDGVLHDEFFSAITPQSHQEVVARLKVMSKLDLAESRRPQDGRLQVRSGKRIVDIRLSCVPTLYGERLVMRLLEKGARAMSMDELGLLSPIQDGLRDCLAHSYGFVLVTGPTGSGKTTTLYTVLSEVSRPDCNVLTIEDPVEYRMKGVGQIQVNDRIGLTFASGLRSILRQDPDVVMVGEIRDPETANIAVNAALTGHLVLSTLHTNDAPTAATRLMDLKVPPFLLSSCLLGVMAQRLVRRLCDKCKAPYQPTAEDFRRLGIEPTSAHQMRRPVGCPVCMQSGFRGRMGIHELMKVDAEISSRIAREDDARELRRLAKTKGMKSLMDDAADKVLLGMTSVDEAVRTARAQ